MNDNVVKIGAKQNQSRAEFESSIAEAIKHLTENLSGIKSIVIVVEDADGFVTWMGPTAEQVSYASAFLNGIIQANLLAQYGL